MAVTIGIKTIIMKILRGTFYSAFYRKRPAASSIMGVILECWSLGLSIGVVTSRFFKLVGVTALYIGRIDVPMLAPGVGYVGPMNLDTAPVSFKVDLLSHEAVSNGFTYITPNASRLTMVSFGLNAASASVNRAPWFTLPIETLQWKGLWESSRRLLANALCPRLDAVDEKLQESSGSAPPQQRR